MKWMLTKLFYEIIYEIYEIYEICKPQDMKIAWGQGAL